MNMTIIWLAAMVAFLIVEAVVPGLISIWFAAGSLAAMLSALFRAPLWLQVVWFVIVSVAALALTRPLAQKYVNARTTPTNADRILGKDCVVRERIDNLNGTGSVAVLRRGGRLFRAGGYGYGTAKKALLAAYHRLFDPFAARRAELAKDPDALEDILREGAKKARAAAAVQMEKVRAAVGL